MSFFAPLLIPSSTRRFGSARVRFRLSAKTLLERQARFGNIFHWITFIKDFTQQHNAMNSRLMAAAAALI